MGNRLILEKIREGNARAFKVFFEEFYPPLCSFLLKHTSDLDTAEEIAQRVFIDFWNKREDIEIKTSIKSYLFKMGYNLFLNDLRDKKKEETLLEKLQYEAIQELEATDEAKIEEAKKLLAQVIKTLPDRCREVLELRMEGFKYQKIASSLNLSVKTVEAQMRIAYIKIRESFGRNYF